MAYNPVLPTHNYGNPYGDNLYPQDFEFQKPVGWDEAKAQQLPLFPGLQNWPSGYPWSVQGEGASPSSWITKPEDDEAKYDFSNIEGQTAMGDNIMRDFNYNVDPATISGPDYLAQFKRGIPENWLQQKKGITGADASKYIARKPIDGTDIDMQYTTGDEFNIPPRKKGFQFPSFLREGLGAIRDKLRPSPEEQFGASYFPQTDTGRVYQDPNQSLYGGMNVDTMWGEGIGGAGQKRMDRLQKNY